MTALVLGNVGSDAMAPPAPLLSDKYLQNNAAEAKRMIWLAAGDDILVTPTTISQPFLDYVNKLKGGSNIASLTTSEKSTKRPLPISKMDLNAGSVLSRSLSFLRSDHISCLEPYIADEVSFSIARFMGDIPVTFRHQNVTAPPEITRSFNDKAIFREFALNLGVPIASGSICGNVVSPILSNLFMHYAFDLWMTRTNPDLPWCRYADDGLVHCRNEQQAEALKAELGARLLACGLQMHPTKTKIVYCKDQRRKGEYPNVVFDFLGYHISSDRDAWRTHSETSSSVATRLRPAQRQ
ncbi:reverse transcriptase domain-containing protein [Mesorhizobium abyssinicae]|uniref:reverse transcriptase domain-containing protein n=1 Tax=Mesorhizobium abyssinicae TaxID=1209958 RepID=UPI003390F7E1